MMVSFFVASLEGYSLVRGGAVAGVATLLGVLQEREAPGHGATEDQGNQAGHQAGGVPLRHPEGFRMQF